MLIFMCSGLANGNQFCVQSTIDWIITEHFDRFYFLTKVWMIWIRINYIYLICGSFCHLLSSEIFRIRANWSLKSVEKRQNEVRHDTIELNRIKSHLYDNENELRRLNSLKWWMCVRYDTLKCLANHSRLLWCMSLVNGFIKNVNH